MKLSFITDEVTQDLHTIIQFAKEHELGGLELRSVENVPIDMISISTLKQYKKIFSDNGLVVSNLAGSFYKCYIENDRDVEKNIEKLKRLCEAANILECPSIRGFAFFKTGDFNKNLPKIIDAFEKPIEIIEEQDKLLLLESDPSVFTTNHGLLACLLDSIQHERVAAIYDPGNDIYDECNEIPYPAGYDLIKKYIRHIHIKDAVRDKNNEAICVKIGTGQVDYRGLLHELKKSGYQGWYSMETHYRKQAVISEELMRLPGGNTFSEGGFEATSESIEALKKLMMEEGMI